MSDADVGASSQTGIYRASRRELLGDAELDGAAGRAQRAMRSGAQVLSVAVRTANSFRRVDCWTGANELVSHAAAAQIDVVAGSLTPLEFTATMVGRIIGDLMPVVRLVPGPNALTVSSISELVPPNPLPIGIEAILVVSVLQEVPRRLVLCCGLDGLRFGQVTDANQPLRCEAAGAMQFWANVLDVLPSSPGSQVEAD